MSSSRSAAVAPALHANTPAPPDSITTVRDLIKYCVANLPVRTAERASEKNDAAALAHKTDGNSLFSAKDFIQAARAFTQVRYTYGSWGLLLNHHLMAMVMKNVLIDDQLDEETIDVL